MIKDALRQLLKRKPKDMIRVAGIVNDSIVDGPGLRLTVFTQGCWRHCPGCHNPQTHDFSGGELKSVSEILSMVEENDLLDGITLSGGEPFMQPEACASLARAVKEMGLSVWCYTGYSFESLVGGGREWRKLLENIDVLVDGAFIFKMKTSDSQFKGSSNQRIINVPASLRERRIVLSSYN